MSKVLFFHFSFFIFEIFIFFRIYCTNEIYTIQCNMFCDCEMKHKLQFLNNMIKRNLQ